MSIEERAQQIARAALAQWQAHKARGLDLGLLEKLLDQHIAAALREAGGRVELVERIKAWVAKHDRDQSEWAAGARCAIDNALLILEETT